MNVSNRNVSRILDEARLGKLLLEAKLDARSLLSEGEDDESTDTAGGVC